MSNISASKRAGYVFPVGRTRRYLKRTRIADRISRAAPVFVASCLEYLTAEILEQLVGNAKENGKKRINPRYIMLAVRNDEEINRLLGTSHLPIFLLSLY